MLRKLRFNISEYDRATPSEHTCYSYSLEVSADEALVTSCSIFGAAYALEGLAQLAGQQGVLPHNKIVVHDAPAYKWRGLMIDSGRRFFPVPLVENLLDTMAAVKLNVLHLHASDFCRWSVESKLFPNLTGSLTGVHAGHYTQADIAHLIKYAADRGIRVVPEFDMPGHSRGLLPLEGADQIHFCTDKPSRNQLFDDPGKHTYNTVRALVGEMASLFSDDVFHIGCDETSVKGKCPLSSTFAFEQRLATAVASELGKTAEGWEEILFSAGAATNSTIVNAWSRHRPPEITKTGRRTVESFSAHFYFTEPAPGGPDGWKKCWYDISTGVPKSELSLLLGGEMSMWSDTYCHTRQCGAYPGATPVGSPLFPPSRDAEFAASIGGMIWPRGFVGAAAFWGYNATADPTSTEFTDAIWKLNDQLSQRGAKTCPSKCDCDQLSACGKPYIKPVPPKAGDTATVEACASAGESGAAVKQQWLNVSGEIVLAVNTSLCLRPPASCASQANCYPLALEPCAARPFAGWEHDATMEVRVRGSKQSSSGSGSEAASGRGICIDIAGGAKGVGTYTCGSGAGYQQPNQHWSVDSGAMRIGALSAGSGAGAEPAAAGLCLSVLSSV